MSKVLACTAYTVYKQRGKVLARTPCSSQGSINPNLSYFHYYARLARSILPSTTTTFLPCIIPRGRYRSSIKPPNQPPPKNQQAAEKQAKEKKDEKKRKGKGEKSKLAKTYRGTTSSDDKNFTTAVIHPDQHTHTHTHTHKPTTATAR